MTLASIRASSTIPKVILGAGCKNSSISFGRSEFVKAILKVAPPINVGFLANQIVL